MKVARITLRRGQERRVVVVESGAARPQVGDDVMIQGERWRVSRLELVNVLARFPTRV
jgi:hypothetical protein